MHMKGPVRDSAVGEKRIAQNLLAVLNTQGAPYIGSTWTIGDWKGFDMILRKNSTSLSTYEASTLALMDGSIYANMDNIRGNSHSINSILNIIIVEIKAILWWKIQLFWLLKHKKDLKNEGFEKRHSLFRNLRSDNL